MDKTITNQILDFNNLKLDKNNIWISSSVINSKNSKKSKKIWDKIYNFNMDKLIDDRKDFNRNKLMDHIHYIEKSYRFSPKTIYLEIGCGPSYIGEYLMSKYKCIFIGVDFNYTILYTLQQYLKKLGHKNFLLIYADINKLPLRNNSIDFIYGGGVIEHFPNTESILMESNRVLKRKGVSFNTVPAFNIAWLQRYNNNIPAVPFLKNIFEFFHINIYKYKLLNKYHGYELSFTGAKLRKMHEETGFDKVDIGPFAFHPSDKKIKSKLMREFFYTISKIRLLNPIYYVSAIKK